MRFHLLVGFVVLSGLAASPVSARFGYCTASHNRAVSFEPTGQHFPQILSGVLDFGENYEHGADAEKQFGAYLRNNSADCSGEYKTIKEAKRAKERRIEFSRGTDTDTGWTGSFAANANLESTSESSGATLGANEVSISFGGSSTKARVERPVPPKYVEVQGPNGPMRLSPEVLARNEAAADEYRRKMEEHARARTEHERKLALHQQSIAAASAEQRAYEQKLAMNAAQVAAHGAALEQHKAATKPTAKGAKGWMYCDARGAPGDKRRFYSRVTEVDYVPGEISIIDVMARNRPAFKSYVAGAHSIFFATDSLLHCPYSTTSLADAEALMARDKRGDSNNAIEIIQTGWMPAN